MQFITISFYIFTNNQLCKNIFIHEGFFYSFHLQLDYDFIRTVRASRYRVRLSTAKTTMDGNGERHLDKKFYINADGEAIKLDTPEFEVRLHQCSMPIYGNIDG